MTCRRGEDQEPSLHRAEARPWGGEGCGCAYGAARGHRTARYWSRHATWKVTCALSGKVTVTASPCTGWAHHAQDRTGCPCRHQGRVTFALLLPFRRSTRVKPPTRPGPETPPAHAESMRPLPRANQRSAGRKADARDAREDGVPISWPWRVACGTGQEQKSPQKPRAIQFSFLSPFCKGGWEDFGTPRAGKSPLAPLCKGGNRAYHRKLNGPAKSRP